MLGLACWSGPVDVVKAHCCEDLLHLWANIARNGPCGSTDSTDLLGCFEQASSARSLYRALDAVEDLLLSALKAAPVYCHGHDPCAQVMKSSAMRVMECLHEMIKEKRAVLDVSATKVEGESAGVLKQQAQVM